MTCVTLAQKCLKYETPQIKVIEIFTHDVIRTSLENGGEDNNDWWEGITAGEAEWGF